MKYFIKQIVFLSLNICQYFEKLGGKTAHIIITPIIKIEINCMSYHVQTRVY